MSSARPSGIGIALIYNLLCLLVPGDSCSKRDECCKPVNEKENSSGCGRTWSAMAGGFVNECSICNLESSMC
uniref:U1-Hexatoxin-Hc1a_1 n=1 Tax=Hadronyche cerberea TaxID=1107879 RepID=A0A4V2H9G9_HADCE